MDTKQSWVENKELREKYFELLETAATCGLDWENDPPPAEMITEELCIASLDNAPEHLGKMPLYARTPAVCFAAVLIDDDALQFVPENLRDEIKARKDAIPEEQWLEELSMFTGNHYIKLTEKLLKPEFIRAMVENNGDTIAIVPEEFKTPELLELAERTIDKLGMDYMVYGDRKYPPLIQTGPSLVMGSSIELLAQKDIEKEIEKE